MFVLVSPPPAHQVNAQVVGLPLQPGSDPMLLAVFQWTVAHSPSFQELVRRTARAERKARYRLVPGLDVGSGGLLVGSNQEEYLVDIQVAILPWSQGGDALEPWIAIAVYLAFDAATKGEWVATKDPYQFRFSEETSAAAFAFEAKVRSEICAADPERLKDLPSRLVGKVRSLSPRNHKKSYTRRTLPDGITF